MIHALHDKTHYHHCFRCLRLGIPVGWTALAERTQTTTKPTLEQLEKDLGL